MSGDPARLLRPGIAGMRAYEAEDPGRLVKLDANENPYPPPAELRERIARAAGELALNRYPDPEAGELRTLPPPAAAGDARGSCSATARTS